MTSGNWLVDEGHAWHLVESIIDPEESGEPSTLGALQTLGGHGLLSLSFDDPRGRAAQFGVISSLAERSLSVAFSAWAHRMVIEYVISGVASPAQAGLFRELSSSQLIGSTAMAPALRASLGLAPVGLSAQRGPDGLIVNGEIAWASNLFEGRTVIVAAVELEDGQHAVTAFVPETSGVTVQPLPPLLALNATSSSSVTVSDAVLPYDLVLSWDLTGFLERVRPVFLVLQTAFCVGLTAGSLANLPNDLGGANLVLRGDIAQVSDDLELLRSEVQVALEAPEWSIPDLIRLRLAAANVAQQAVGVEARATGGRGYLATAAVSRRLREVAFLPIQSPTEAQLRWELSCFA